MAIEAAYRLTRRKGVAVSVVEHVASAVDGTTGKREVETTVHNVKKVVVEPTAYSRLIKAQAAQQDVGPTQFIFWTKDIPFRRLTVESFIAVGSDKYQVVSSVVEDDSLVVTGKEYVGDLPRVEIKMNVSNSLGLAGEAAEV